MTIKRAIRGAVREFFSKDWSFKEFLTEDDVRCRLFVSLQNSLNQYSDISIHSEIRWYGNVSGKENKLKYRSDIVITVNNDLLVENEELFKLPSKGYQFDKYHAIIELKLRRPNNGDSDIKYDDIIQKDALKLIEIKEKTETFNGIDRSYFVLAFDKKRGLKKMIDVENSNATDWQTWSFQL